MAKTPKSSSQMASESDESLMRRVVRHDSEAFEELIRRYGGMLFGYALRFMKKEDAEEIVHDVFLCVRSKAPEWDSKRSFRPWLFAIATNMCLASCWDRMNREQLTLKKKHEIAVTTHSRTHDPVACAQTKEVKEIIEGCIDKLPNDRQREMAYLRWIRGFSRKDIAETMKVSIGCVDNDLASAREALRDDLIPFAQDL